MKGLCTIVLMTVLVSCGQEPAAPSPLNSSSSGIGSAPKGVWISRNVISTLPAGGAGWASVEDQAHRPCGRIDLADQDSGANVCVLAKALVFARTGSMSHKIEVIAALRDLAGAAPYRGRALGLGRELAAYVIAADLIELSQSDPLLDRSFRTAIAGLLTTRTSDGPGSLVECHEMRPNNWGTNCGASRAAVLAYLDDTAGLERVAQVFRGWLGDRSAYSGFKFGELWWQCDPSRPVAINPTGCARNGYSIDGVLPDDQRRAGPFVWPPPKENYVYEALQGAVVQAVILEQAGHAAFSWENKALLRAFRWLQSEAVYPASGDDMWIVPLINHYYGTNYPASGSGRPGKVMGWTEWTHER